MLHRMLTHLLNFQFSRYYPADRFHQRNLRLSFSSPISKWLCLHDLNKSKPMKTRFWISQLIKNIHSRHCFQLSLCTSYTPCSCNNKRQDQKHFSQVDFCNNIYNMCFFQSRLRYWILFKNLLMKFSLNQKICIVLFVIKKIVYWFHFFSD